MKTSLILLTVFISTFFSESQAKNLSTLQGLEALCLRQVELKHEGFLPEKDILENKRSCQLIKDQNKNEFFAVFNMVKAIEKNEGRSSVLGPSISYIAKEFSSPPSDSWIKRMPGAGREKSIKLKKRC